MGYELSDSEWEIVYEANRQGTGEPKRKTTVLNHFEIFELISKTSIEGKAEPLALSRDCQWLLFSYI